MVYNKLIIQYVIEETINSGINDLLIVTGKNKRSIEDHFDKPYELEHSLQRAGKDRDLKKIRKITDLADICYVRQKGPKGLADAIKCSQKHIADEPFAVLLGHSITKSKIPCTRQLINIYMKYNSSAVALTNDNMKYAVTKSVKADENIYKINNVVKLIFNFSF